MKKALVIINIANDESMDIALEMKTYLKTVDVDADFISFDGFSNNYTFENYDFAITLGGDGTVLYAARNCVEYDIPVFPINLGQFGFIASVKPEKWKEELSNYLNGKSEISERLLLEVNVLRKGELVYSSLGLNDAVISAKRSAATVSLDVKYDDVPLCKLKSDGVIVATPTGSTAYSVAAGGPIVDPCLEAFVFTPINPFSLSTRPIVLNPKGELSITICNGRVKESSISIDGQESFDLFIDDVIVVKSFEKKISLINSTQKQFYNALTSKLNWSGVPHA